MLLLDESSALTWWPGPGAMPEPAGVDPPPTAQQWADAQNAAVNWLWSKSGRRFGTRATTYRPQGLYISAWAYYDVLPYLQSIYGPLWGEGWPYLGDPRFGDPTVRQILELPGPAASVESVTLTDGDGVTTTLLATDMPVKFRLDGNWLVRVDGSTWPDTQDLIAQPGSPNTWSVDYTRGVVPPVDGILAFQALAAEWVKLIVGDKSCKLPWNTSSVTRAGVTVQLDPMKAGRTSGLQIVDRFITNANPNALQQEPRVWSPDISRNGAPYGGSHAPYRPLG